ncbi:MAG: hypothetical protein AAF235_07265 [Planctomycetota bacterium]
MTLTIEQYGTQYSELERHVASAVWMPDDGSQLILYDPNPDATTNGARDQLGTWSILAAPPKPAEHLALRRYASALTTQLVGAARVSREARVAAAVSGAPAFQSQNVQASLATVQTTHAGTDLATRSYTVVDPSAPSGQGAMLVGFTPGAAVAGAIEGVRAVLDMAVAKIDAMTAAV